MMLSSSWIQVGRRSTSIWTVAGSIHGILLVEDNHHTCIWERSRLKITDDWSCVLLKESVQSRQW